MKRYLLCTDLDRTLIPNGEQPLSALAKQRFAQLVAREDVTLAYVTGRHRALIEQAIAEYDLPIPDYAVADVGSTIYQVGTGGWREWLEWGAQIAPDWDGLRHDQLHQLLHAHKALRLQEDEKQGHHKLSYYVSLEADAQKLIVALQNSLTQSGIKANLIWSIDEAAHIGLLDVLPSSANKLHAIHFLMRSEEYSLSETIFAGDSGNDLDVLLSDVPSVLVANADTEVKARAAQASKDALYIAQGNYLGMNGNYCAGILEGAAHYWPEVDDWLHKLD